MNETLVTRREAIALAVAAVTPAPIVAAGARDDRNRTDSIPRSLERYVTNYLRTMNAPALALSLATREGHEGAGAYGFTDIAARVQATPSQAFQIGSITKSFAGLAVLQMQDEGKLDVQHPILRYLPWLPIETDYGEIRIHHLLTHTSGMPNQAPLIPAEPGARIRQGFAPGTRFHYSNWGYNVLGSLIEAIDGCSWPTAITRRVLQPLGMLGSVGAITSATRSRIAPSYQALHDDRPYPRRGPLVPAGNLTFPFASGSIAATPADMSRYMQMLLNRGAGPSRRLISENAFALFSTGHVEAPDFGPGARYGYGLAVDRLDGHTRLRHTGGMPSFMSSMQLDLDAGVGAFASVNAYQGYRPNAVVLYALRLLRGGEAEAPPLDEWPEVEDTNRYTGAFLAPDGEALEVKTDGRQLLLRSNGESIPLQPRGGHEFLADHPRFALFPLVFSGESTPSPQAQGDVWTASELGYGPDWYAHARFKGERTNPTVRELAPFVGVFRPDDTSLSDTVRVVQRRGRLWLDGTAPLESIGGDRFRIAGEPGLSETLEFRGRVSSQAQLLLANGHVLRRTPIDPDA